jgi:hypothetical protein
MARFMADDFGFQDFNAKGSLGLEARDERDCRGREPGLAKELPARDARSRWLVHEMPRYREIWHGFQLE